MPLFGRSYNEMLELKEQIGNEAATKIQYFYKEHVLKKGLKK